ncbi:MAG: 6-carboxytetrahydropterin synthase [Acidobacteriota bacterium]|nr:6-carboxytetrahydropterin synthase [Acidobacteriota bacterium]
MSAAALNHSTPRAYLSRRYRLSASHRLHSEAFTAEQNQAVYGKCNNPHGHGHNYIVEVTFGGPVDPTTGMVCDLGELDAFAQTNLLQRFDTMNLNTLDAFRDVVSTTENFTIEVFWIFKQFPGATLQRARIEETSNNSFEYAESFEKG